MNGKFNNNKEPISDCDNESGHHDYKPGHYYDGNETMKAGERQAGQGSCGLAYDQGALRYSEIPEIENLDLSKDSSIYTVPEDKQGSAAHLKQNNKVSYS